MAMSRRCKLVLLLAALAAVVMVASAVSLKAEHQTQQLESEHSLKNQERRREREWWEEEEEEEESERERRREREEEERERREREREEVERKRREWERRQREREEEERKRREREEGEEEERGRPSKFVLQKPKALVKTAAGSLRVLPRRRGEELAPLKQLGLGFVTLEPKALLLPHYLDAPVVLYVLQGSARLGFVSKSRYASTELTDGDIYTLPGGTVHYILNTDSRLRLNIFSALDARNSLNPGHFQPFFVAGGLDPPTVLSGFSPDVLAAAYKVDREHISEILGVQTGGAIIFTTRTAVNKSTADVRPMLPNKPAGSWSNGWNALQDLLEDPWDLLVDPLNRSKKKPFNLLKKKPDFKNDNGWSSIVDKKDFKRLKHADLSLFAVNLNAGSMLAPHWNPVATEIALVTKGRGYVHVAFPNGTAALDTEVTEGTVFVVPRYYPVSQVASRDCTFQFVGFSTTSEHNKPPEFLAGDNSVLNLLAKDKEYDVLAASFDVPKDTVRDFLAAQKDVVILPGYVVDSNEERLGRAAY